MRKEDTGEPGGRFDDSTKMGQMYRARYLHDGYFDALKMLKEIAVFRPFDGLRGAGLI